MRLSTQAHGALMMCLQKAIMEETDIRPLLDDLDFIVDDDEPEFLLVTNPPVVKASEELQEAIEKKEFEWTGA
jgi:hypothetical protein